ncbi:nuclear polyadenylated RNA-binding protein NAB2 [Folsomia candida]|uniref:nuclear polyadenylated RNA-binding protein NAB2 n=1 Tax=Folsomia candida TaxID=158441 RepID=UPI000B8F7858|nr:nuclear polyadenylated RNA-binding protein NAB2 [Folsomia candida]
MCLKYSRFSKKWLPAIITILVAFSNLVHAAPSNNAQARQETSANGAAEGTAQTLDGVAVLLASIFKGISDIPVNAINAVIRPLQQSQGIPVMIGNSMAAQPIQNAQRFQQNSQALQTPQVQNLQPQLQSLQSQNAQLQNLQLPNLQAQNLQPQPIQVAPVQQQPQIQYVNPIVITSPPVQQPVPTQPPPTTSSSDDDDATTTSPDDADEDSDADSENSDISLSKKN